jgi:hypothetical protein
LTRDEAQTELCWQEKREARFQRWLSAPGVKFINAEAEQSYKARVNRIVDAIRLREPDRVPCFLPAGTFPAFYGGINIYKAMSDGEAMKQAWRKFLRDFDNDVLVPPIPTSARADALLQNKARKSPGNGLPENASMSQYVGGEYMKADEYDALIEDPSDFFLRTYLPRVMGAFQGFDRLIPFRYAFGLPGIFLEPAALPEVQAAFQKIVDYGKEMMKAAAASAQIISEGQAMGFPLEWGGGAHAPFDLLGDTLRGTRGILTDMHRRPDKLHEAMEVCVAWIVESALRRANLSGRPLIFMALHKGDDAHMSGKQFETFYWPYLKRVILGLVNEGCVPLLFAEGIYNSRLEVIKDLPKASVIWWFDRTDMAAAKHILGDTACLAGNVPTSLMCTGTPTQVKECCRQLIEICGKGGGYILTGGAQVHYTPCVADNLHAMMEVAKEFGVYKRAVARSS